MPSADDFRALARSSPWRWTTLHLRRRSDEPCEAWVVRPDDLLVRTPEGRWFRERDDAGGGRALAFAWSPGPGDQPGGVPEPPVDRGLRPGDVVPTYRADGLVAARPEAWDLDYGDVVWGDYTWVAMLDPVELSHAVELTDIRSGDREGRGTWWARARPLEGYDPTCGCCPLLFSAVSERVERGDGWRPDPDRHYPTTYEVGLDVATGVAVHVAPLDAAGDDLVIDLAVLGVDEDHDPLLAAHPWRG